MTEKETAQILIMMDVVYPDVMKDKSDAERRMRVKVWHRLFEREPVQLVTAALEAYITSNTANFAPVPGQIKEQIRKLTAGDEMTDAEAWSLVLRAIKRSSYGYAEEFQKLPETLKRCVGRPEQLREWAIMDEETVSSVIASNFRKTYRARKQSEAEMVKLPDSVKLAISGLSGKMLLEGEAGSAES